MMPNRKFSFGQELYKRAVKEQTPEETVAQEAFLKGVQESGRVCITFDDLAHLAQKVTRRFGEWAKGGIFDEAERADATTAFANIKLPSDKDLAELGWSSQSRKFSDAFDIIKDQGQSEVVGFLIHGPDGYGHQQVLDRLRIKYERDFDSQPHRLIVSIGAQWHGKSLVNLLKYIGAGIEQGYVPESANALAERLQDLLKSNDVLLEITDLHRFEGALPEFVNQFWNPIASQLSIEPQLNRLVALVTMEQPASKALDSFLFDTLKDKPKDLNLAKIFKLPELEAFTIKEIATSARDWLKKDAARSKDPKKLNEEAQSLAKTLHKETGGKPVTLYSKLKSYATWTD
jgi:hypothetical protein